MQRLSTFRIAGCAAAIDWVQPLKSGDSMTALVDTGRCAPRLGYPLNPSNRPSAGQPADRATGDGIMVARNFKTALGLSSEFRDDPMLMQR
ncbi:MAG TPA: hypothetical protein VET87_24485 [Rubrivivax sp.]|nr:hypothetical protein [Rubrivivax sp.]